MVFRYHRFPVIMRSMRYDADGSGKWEASVETKHESKRILRLVIAKKNGKKSNNGVLRRMRCDRALEFELQRKWRGVLEQMKLNEV